MSKSEVRRMMAVSLSIRTPAPTLTPARDLMVAARIPSAWVDQLLLASRHVAVKTIAFEFKDDKSQQGNLRILKELILAKMLKFGVGVYFTTGQPKSSKDTNGSDGNPSKTTIRVHLEMDLCEKVGHMSDTDDLGTIVDLVVLGEKNICPRDVKRANILRMSARVARPGGPRRARNRAKHTIEPSQRARGARPSEPPLSYRIKTPLLRMPIIYFLESSGSCNSQRVNLINRDAKDSINYLFNIRTLSNILGLQSPDPICLQTSPQRPQLAESSSVR
jgi:hypothetical protein